RDVPRARGRNVLPPRPGLAIDHAEHRGTGRIGRRHVELTVARVVPDLVTAADLRDVADDGAIDSVDDEREGTGDEEPLKRPLRETGAAAAAADRIGSGHGQRLRI